MRNGQRNRLTHASNWFRLDVHAFFELFLYDRHRLVPSVSLKMSILIAMPRLILISFAVVPDVPPEKVQNPKVRVRLDHSSPR